jgi:hypothetical protein
MIIRCGRSCEECVAEDFMVGRKYLMLDRGGGLQLSRACREGHAHQQGLEPSAKVSAGTDVSGEGQGSLSGSMLLTK